MEKVVHILIGHYTNIILSSETIVPIGTKPYRNIVWKSSIYNFHSAAINWKKKYHNPNSSKIKYQNRRKRQMDTPTHKYNYMTTGLVQALQYKVTGLT